MSDLAPFAAAVRKACGARLWSKGVDLARGDAVNGVAESADDVELRVRAPGRTVALTVLLYPEDNEWDCSCGAKGPVCEHVAASTIALTQARARGERLPVTKKPRARIVYRLGTGDGLVLERFVLHGDEPETLFSGSLGSPPHRDQIEAREEDLTIDRLLTVQRSRKLRSETLETLVELLADSPDVFVDGAAVTVSSEVFRPLATLTDAKTDIRLTVKPPAGFDRAIDRAVGLGMRDGRLTLAALAGTGFAGPRYCRLPLDREVARREMAVFLNDVFPAIEAACEVVRKSDVDLETVRLRPRVVMSLTQAGDGLSVLPTLVYGDPPQARVEGENLVHLQGAVVKRIRRLEEKAKQEFEQHSNYRLGHRSESHGADAHALATRLRAGGTQLSGVEHLKRFPSKALNIELSFADGLSVHAVTPDEQSRAEGQAVLDAWRRGDTGVPLMGGGWAPLPQNWLSRFGDRLAALFDARQPDGSVARHAQVAAVELCEDLGVERPPELNRLRPLFEGFSKLPVATLPPDFQAELRPYQTEGVNWLSFLRDAELGAILADDMGLGKTIQALAVMQGRSLVVCPRSVVHNWVSEAKRFRPNLKVAVYHGAGRQLDDEAELTVTTYALLRRDVDALSAVRWSNLFLDESQAIKNPSSQVARAAFRLDAEFRVTLSGTPVENRLDELWSQMQFANRGMLGPRKQFADHYEEPIANGDAARAESLRARIRPFVLRRLKIDVLKDLPPRTDSTMFVELTDEERSLYDTIMMATRKSVASDMGKDASAMQILEALLRLRQASCDPALVPGGLTSVPTSVSGRSSKVERLIDALESMAANGHRALVFSQWTGFLDRIELALGETDLQWCRLDGSTRDRESVVNGFQSPDGPPVMLISLKAGGTGLNLTAADHVFIADPWYNPAVEQQAADRAHRFGQERPVNVYRLVARNTVEEGIIALQQKKRLLAEAALGEGSSARLTRDDLLGLLE